MHTIGLIQLRSSLSIGDKSLLDEAESFLSRISCGGELEFRAPSKGGFSIFLILTGGSEIYFKDIYKRHKEPYYIVPTGTRNSLAASLEIMSFLKREGKEAKLVLGSEEAIGRELLLAVRAFDAKRRFMASRLGVIGSPSNWLIASNVNPQEAKKRFGVTLVPIPMREYLQEVSKRFLDDDGALLKRFRSKTRRKEDLRESIHIHFALKHLAEKHRLDGFTLRCFDLLKKMNQTSCLSFGVLNEEGITAGCEGDVPALLSMHMFRCVSGHSSFMCNPALIDVEKKQAIYAHCTCPFDLLRSYKLDTHFESGAGIGIKGELKEQAITAFKLSPDLKNFRVLRGKIVENLNQRHLCRTQVRVQFDEDIRPLLDDPYGNHMVIGYGDYADELKAFFHLFAN